MRIELHSHKLHGCANCPFGSVVDGEAVCSKVPGRIRFWDDAFKCPEDRWGRAFVAHLSAVPRPVPNVKPKMAGAGDLVKRVTDALGIPQCGGCVERQAALNKLLPFGSSSPPAGDANAAP